MFKHLFARLTVTQKLLLIAGLVGIWLTMVMGSTIYAQYRAIQSVTEVIENQQPAITITLKLKAAIKDASTALGFYLLTGKDHYKTVYLNNLNQYQRYIDQLKALPAVKYDENSLFMVKDIEEDLIEFGQYKKETLLKDGQNNNIELDPAHQYRQHVAQIIEKKLGPAYEHLSVDLDLMVSIHQAHIDEANKNTLSLMKNNISNTIIFTCIGTLLGLIYLYFVNKIIIKPLKRSVSAMAEISEHGDLNQSLPFTGNDEFAALATAFNGFVTKIKGVVDLVISSSDNLVVESKQLSEATGQSAHQVEQQKAQIDACIESFNGMTQMLSGITQHTSGAVDAVQEVRHSAEQGRDIVANTVNAINQVANQVEDASNAVQNLDSLSEGIGDIVTVIKGITEQTNLLALNAAIEAARAGEHGRGFAVVADEVRKLSSTVQEQTGQIHAEIEKLQHNVKNVVKIMAAGRTEARATVELASQAGEALDTITQSVITITDQITKISAAANSNNQQAAEISSALHGIGKIADDTAQTAQQASSTGNEFTFLSHQLKDLVNQILLSHKDKEETGDNTEQNNDNTTLF